MSLKVDLFKAIAQPLLQEVGKRTGEVIAKRIFGSDDNQKSKVEKKK